MFLLQWELVCPEAEAREDRQAFKKVGKNTLLQSSYLHTLPMSHIVMPVMPLCCELPAGIVWLVPKVAHDLQHCCSPLDSACPQQYLLLHSWLRRRISGASPSPLQLAFCALPRHCDACRWGWSQWRCPCAQSCGRSLAPSWLH